VNSIEFGSKWVLIIQRASLALVATDPSNQLTVATIDGAEQTLSQWLTYFNLLTVVLDPYTHESGWIIPTAARIFAHYEEADVRCAFVVTSDADGAREYLGKYSKEWLVLIDEDRELVRSLGLERLPALTHIAQDGSLAGFAEGWNPADWKGVLAGVEEAMAWRCRPLLPAPEDPGAFEGTPALS
jgi:hypothetical protein